MLGLLKKFHVVLGNLPEMDLNKPFPEQFALKRFDKKFQVPLEGIDERLHLEAWETFLSTDDRLCLPSRVDGLWYKVRKDLRRHTYKFNSDVSFPKGSEFFATRGNNSLECRLAYSVWTVTPDCFDQFANLVYNHKALKRAARERYTRWYRKQNLSTPRKVSEKYLWTKLGNAKSIFNWKLSKIVQFEHGSRFSTVPKNNAVRRPINIECFGNMIIQKQMGDCFREIVTTSYGNNMSVLQGVHKTRLTDRSIATIDLKNASDSINLDLIRFLLPTKVFNQISKSRSEYILGPDDNYYPLKKVSSMGNGFTFELMTLILTSLCRVLDPLSSVYGDDIIIANEHAPRLIKALEDVGFQVNIEKSFINSEFRESCGGNFHDQFGYIESYDFLWPENVHDCITFYNKAKQLSLLGYAFFNELVASFDEVIPPALRGPSSGVFCTPGYKKAWDDQPDDLGGFFRQGIEKSLARFKQTRSQIATRYQYDIDSVTIHYGMRYTPELRTPCLKDLIRKHHWAKYEMYLSAMKRTKDVITGSGCWDIIVLCTIEGRTSTLASLMQEEE